MLELKLIHVGKMDLFVQGSPYKGPVMLIAIPWDFPLKETLDNLR